MDTRPATAQSGRLTNHLRRLSEQVEQRRRLSALIAGALAVTIVAGLLAWQPATPPVTGTAPTPSADPTDIASPPGAPSGSPVSPPDPDTRTAVARLEASDDAAGTVPAEATFRLTSLDGTASADLARRLVVQPQLAFDVVPEPDPASVVLVPRTKLAPGTIYRFDLAGNAGQLLDSWAFQARQGVRVVGTIPSNEATEVPLDTGIEITFDQDGVTDAADHVTIEPAVRGRFEQHGRVLVFVPKALAPATAYTVTVSAGVTVGATGEKSTEATTFRFETAGGRAPDGRIEFQDTMIESAVGERPTMGFWELPENDDWVSPKKLSVEVYRLPSIDAAIEGFQALRTWQWTRVASDGMVRTDTLPRVLRGDLALETTETSRWVALPNPLPAGWYVVQVGSAGGRSQAILQVSNVSAYLALSDTSTVVWANDVGGDRPIAEAVVHTGNSSLGRTGANGLLETVTPTELLTDCTTGCPRVLTITTGDGRAAILPTVAPSGHVYYANAGWGEPSDNRFWSVFDTDRTRFRPTDTINAWGLLRQRDTGEVPSSVTVRLAPGNEWDGGIGPAVASIDLAPGPTGVFAGSLALKALPLGAYTLEVVADGTVVERRSTEIGQILKPAYRVELTTGHRVYIAGDPMRVTVRASFFDGTPVPGLPIRLTDYIEDTATTNASGVADIRTLAHVGSDNDGSPDYRSIYVTPRGPEEGEIAGASRQFVVFPSSQTIDGAGGIANGRVTVTGSVHAVDQDRLNEEIGVEGELWQLDPRGEPIGGARVTVRFTEQVPIRGEGRQVYDFLQKKVTTVYDYDVTTRDAGSVTVRADAKGRYEASIPADTEGHDYEISVTSADADGRITKQTVYASTAQWTDRDGRTADLRPTIRTRDSWLPYGIGESVDLTFIEPAGKTPVRSFLFLDAQRGIRSAALQSSPRFVTPFTEAFAPQTTVLAVRFNGSGYDVANAYNVRFRSSDRALQVELSMRSSRNKPGDTVTVDARVRDASGNPVAAAVVLRAIDEKLFASGDAIAGDTLGELYRSVSSGVRATYATHRPPLVDEGYGDTGGGGDTRVDFRDSLVFTTIDTGPDGRGSVSFKLSDDVTSWRVIGTAVTRDLAAGSGSVQVPVGLPFFVETTIAPEYLVADRPSIVVRAYGDALEAGDRVSFTVESQSLGLNAGPISGTAFSPLAVALPALTTGRHELTIRATSGTGSSALADGVKRTITVVASRLSRTTSQFEAIVGSTRPQGGPGLTTVVVSDAGAGRSVPLLIDVASADGARMDSSLAAAAAADLLITRLKVPAEGIPPNDFGPERYQAADGGLTLLPYASSDLELTTLAALVGPERFDPRRMAMYLAGVAADRDETRERHVIALAGLAALGEPVLPELRAAAENPDLTIRERLFVGVGAARIGDAARARSIADDLIRTYGEQSAGQLRLRVGETAADATRATSLAAVLAASVGDRRAPLLWASVEANPSPEAILGLQAVAYAEATLDWLDSKPARFAWTVDGKRTVVDLVPGGASSFTVTAGQLASLTIERLDGAVAVTTTWREPAEASTFSRDPDVSITRRVTPAGPVTPGALVQVDISVKFGPSAAAGCHAVTDHVPSGLVPVSNVGAFVDPDTEAALPDATLPYAKDGQLVHWCAAPSSQDRTVELRYFARVITPGTYVWQPAVVSAPTATDRASVTAETRIQIR